MLPTTAASGILGFDVDERKVVTFGPTAGLLLEPMTTWDINEGNT